MAVTVASAQMAWARGKITRRQEASSTKTRGARCWGLGSSGAWRSCQLAVVRGFDIGRQGSRERIEEGKGKRKGSNGNLILLQSLHCKSKIFEQLSFQAKVHLSYGLKDNLNSRI